MKTDLDTVNMVLTKHDIEQEIRVKVLRDIETEIEKSKSEKTPKTKNQYVILAITEDENISEVPLYVLQIPEMDNPLRIPESIGKAASAFNTSRKGRKNPVNTVGEALEAVSRKFFKEENVSVKTNLPVFTITSTNKLDLPVDEE